MDTLESYRNEIDKIDVELTKLFEKRMDVALKVAQYKKSNNIQLLHNKREKEVIEKSLITLQKKQNYIAVVKFLDNIMEISKDLQKKELQYNLKHKNVTNLTSKNTIIGFSGSKGSFTEEAAFKFFGDCTKKTYKGFEKVFIAVQNKEINYGIIPMENSTAGIIQETYDCLQKYKVAIIGYECMKIEHHLMGIKGSDINELTEVYSHDQALRQCSNYFKNYPNCKLIQYHDTAASGKLISNLNDIKKAAICNKSVAKLYNLQILKDNIHNKEINYTKFVIITNVAI